MQERGSISIVGKTSVEKKKRGGRGKILEKKIKTNKKTQNLLIMG